MRIRTILLTVLCAVCTLPAYADFKVGDFSYEENGSNCTLTGYSGPGGAVTIPSSVTNPTNGVTYTVTTLGYRVDRSVIGPDGYPKFGCFEKNKNITSVTIPNTVTRIRVPTFGSCTSLTTVILGNSIEVIESLAFYGCTSLTYIGLPDLSTSTSNFPGSLTSIGNEAFIFCSSLTSVEVPASVTSFGTGIFMDCSSLQSAVVHSALSAVPDFMFSGCTSLTHVEFPNSAITSIERGAFGGCGFSEIVIPEGVTYIGQSAFSGCSNAVSLTIPNTVETIGISAFGGCSSLVSLTIPNSVTSIGTYAFLSLSSLQDVYVSWQTPVIINRNVFEAADIPEITLHVPPGTVDVYKAAAVWQNFRISDGTTDPSTFTITASAGSGGSINPSGSITVNRGESRTFTATPNSGKTVDQWTINGNVVATSGNTYTVSNIQANMTVQVTFRDISGTPPGTSTLTVSPSALIFTASGETQSIAVTSNISWTASGDASWFTVSPASGSNSGAISVTAAANTEAGRRTGTVTVAGGGITQIVDITQAGEELPDSIVMYTGTGEKKEKRIPYLPDGGELYRWDGQWTAAGSYRLQSMVDYDHDNGYIYHPTIGGHEYVFRFGKTDYSSETIVTRDADGYITSLQLMPSSDIYTISPGIVTISYREDHKITYIEWIHFGYLVYQAFYEYDAGGRETSFENHYYDPVGWEYNWGFTVRITAEYDAWGRKTYQEYYRARYPDPGYSLEEYEIYYYPDGRTSNIEIDNNSSGDDTDQGGFDIHITFPADSIQTGWFEIRLPDGFTLDGDQTRLSMDFSDYTLVITRQADNTWLLEIKSKGTGSVTPHPEEVSRILAHVIYTVDSRVERGSYTISICNIQFETPGGDVIPEPTLTVPVRLDRWGIGNETVEAPLQVTCFNGILTVESPAAEQVEIYSLSGSLLHSARKAAGEATFDVGHLPRGVLIVRGSSGWTRKIVLK